jgi:chemotaxis receptor (MCP) glutamine deamidase CheD
MAANEEGLPEIYLQPGESHLVKEPTILRTLLGSCVGIAFRIPRLGVGALCHPMLPRFPVKPAATMTPFRRPPLRGLCDSRSGPAV